MLRSLIATLFSIVVSIPWLSLVMLARPFSRNAAFHLMKAWGHFCLRLFGVRLEILDENRGRYPATAVWLFLNQDSLLEMFFLPASIPRPVRLIINLEFALIPFLGWSEWLYGNLVVIRQWKAQSRRIFGRALRRLLKGDDVGVSIEGRRSPDGSLSHYRKGPILLAIQSKTPIIPMIVRGASRCLPYGSFLIRPGHIQVVIKKAVPTGGLTYDDRDDLVSRLRAVAESELGFR